jgi:predicted Zn-dependent protease
MEAFPMLSQDEIKSILDKVMSVSTADETEAYVGSYRNSLTRFAENHIHQNVSQDNVYLSVTAILGNRMGEASINKMDDDSIKRVVSDAIEIAKISPPDEELLPRMSPQKYQEVQAYDPDIDNLTPMDRAKEVAYVVKACEKNGLKTAGAFTDGSGISAIGNSKGLFASYKRSDINFSVSVMGDDGSGWADKSSFKRSEIDVKSLGQIAIDKAISSRNPKDIPPGNYTAILEPNAASELIDFMLYGFNALAVDEGRSFLTDKMEQNIVGDYVTLVSDPYHPLHQGRPYDGDGIPTKKIELIKNGVARNLVYDRLTAKKHGVEPTGHGGGGRNAYGAYPSCPVMDGGNSTLEEMIASTDRGILVTRFWYTNYVDPMKLVITGMTRDGTFWIENGKITHGIKNFRINQNVLDMLNNVEMMSKPVLAGGIVVPAMKVRDFDFSSGTDAV